MLSGWHGSWRGAAPSATPVCVCCRWNQLDLAIVLLSVMGIILEEIEISAALPINPTIIRIMRVLRIARGTSIPPHKEPAPRLLQVLFQSPAKPSGSGF